MTNNRTIHLGGDNGVTTDVLFMNTHAVILADRYGHVASEYIKIAIVSGESIEIGILSADEDMGEFALPLNGVIRGTKNTEIRLTPRDVSAAINDQRIVLTYRDVDMKQIYKHELILTIYSISLDVDADRDGVIEHNNPNKGTWKSGPDGHGGILVVRSDHNYMGAKRELPIVDSTAEIVDCTDETFEEYTHVKIRTRGPPSPQPHTLRIFVNEEMSQRIVIFNLSNPVPSEDQNFCIIGFRQETTKLEVPSSGEVDLLAFGTIFPDEGFDGLIEINLEYRPDMTPLFIDKVALKVAPWIMTPNTQKPIKFFAAEMSNGLNKHYLDSLEGFSREAGIPFHKVPPGKCRSNQWMQDEIEFGYSNSPTIVRRTVLHSPRDRGFTVYVKTQLAGEMGVIERYNPDRDRTSLDCFGNLECSPPVTVDGVDYPFGRIYYGSTLASCQGLADSTEMGPFRRMMKLVRRFLHGQKVQKPFELYSDWLMVGHVDEFCSFVPANSGKNFKLLLASPALFFKLMENLQQQGYGSLKLLEGLKWLDDSKAEISVDEFINGAALRRFNDGIQRYLDYNRDILKRELALDERDIIDIPLPFHGETKDWAGGRAVAYLPDVINLVVLGNYLAIPKPFGPVVNGTCYLQSYIVSALEPLGLHCRFIDDWKNYHVEDGEVHCGSNTLRQPFFEDWWNMADCSN